MEPVFSRNAKLLLLAIPCVFVGGVTSYIFGKWLLTKKHQPKRFSLGRRFHDIKVILTPGQWEESYSDLVKDTANIRVVGFDCEWVCNGRRHPVAIIQIATHSGLCLIVGICHMTSAIPATLKTFLADRSILKVGVAVRDDARKLFRDYGLSVQGCVDLRHLMTRVRGLDSCRSMSLKGLAQNILHVELNKDRQVRCGDWEAKDLSRLQIEYAAKDALVAVDIFTAIVAAKLEHKQIEGHITEDGFWLAALSLCQGIVGAAFKGRSLELVEESEYHKSPVKPKCEWKKASRAYSLRQRPLYYNCQLLAPDGQMLCTCDVRKAEWYIMKGLGVKVADDPLTIKLRFEPSGRPESEMNYYTQDKQNVCVVCGKDESYIRKNIVPHDYRRYFPHLMKEHSSHDVLLMCPQCHQVTSNYDSVLKQTLAEECGAPLETGTSCRLLQDHDLQRVRSAAKAIKLSGSQIPAGRLQELENTVKSFFEVDELTEELLAVATDMDIKIVNSQYVSHGQKVVEHMKKHGGLTAFEKIWRHHFVDKMHPQFLPKLWSVDHTRSNTAYQNNDVS